MTVTQIDLDDDELEQAMRNLGTATKKDTVNTALREVNARRRRLAAMERMSDRYERGEFDSTVAEWECRKGAEAGPTTPAQ